MSDYIEEQLSTGSRIRSTVLVGQFTHSRTVSGSNINIQEWDTCIAEFNPPDGCTPDVTNAIAKELGKMGITVSTCDTPSQWDGLCNIAVDYSGGHRNNHTLKTAPSNKGKGKHKHPWYKENKW